ncbi:MAG: endonuclease I family protein [Bacteriovoracia bacterium]
MKLFATFLFVLFSFATLAQEDQRLSGGKWAYYGEEFYTTLTSKKSLSRTLFNKIFNHNHITQKGNFDEISSNCPHGSRCYRHLSVGYDRARKIMFGELDIKRDGNGTYVVDVYCGKKFYFSNVDEVSRMHDRVNIEHTWPQSKFNGNFGKDMQKSDMHHLYLTDSQANSARGNSPFGLVHISENRLGSGEGCGKSLFGITARGEVYTPPASHRGNVARALFYFSMHYNLGISQTEEAILRLWHKADPVDENELRRHEQIAKYQKVRNPFVDHPEIVDRISDF